MKIEHSYKTGKSYYPLWHLFYKSCKEKFPNFCCIDMVFEHFLKEQLSKFFLSFFENIFSTVRRYVTILPLVTTQCVQCATSGVHIGDFQLAVPTPERPTCLTTMPRSSSLCSWLYGVRTGITKCCTFTINAVYLFTVHQNFSANVLFMLMCSFVCLPFVLRPTLKYFSYVETLYR